MSFATSKQRSVTLIGLLGALFILLTAAASAENPKKDAPENECYMSYSNDKDHMVVGCEVDGYHKRYDLAQQGNVFMVMLPDGVKSIEKTPVLFMTTTYPLHGRSVRRLFEEDLEGVLKTHPGTQVVKKILKDTPAKMGECAGAEITVRDAHFPHQTYFFCKNASSKYAIMVSVIAQTKQDLNMHYEGFLRWANVPQIVTDHKTMIIEEPQ